MNFNWVSSLKF